MHQQDRSLLNKRPLKTSVANTNGLILNEMFLSYVMRLLHRTIYCSERWFVQQTYLSVPLSLLLTLKKLTEITIN